MSSTKSTVIVGKNEHGFDRSHGTPKVGFYGCARGGGQVVRLMLDIIIPRGRRYPQHMVIACPACGHEHDIKPFWRAYNEKLDAGRTFTTVEYVLPE